MKKTILILILAVAPFLAKAQFPIPVTDIAHIEVNMTSWLEQINKEECKDKQMEYIRQLLKEKLERYTRASEAIQNNVFVIKLIKKQYKIYNNMNDFYNVNEETASAKYYNNYKKRIDELKDQLQRNIDEADRLKSSGNNGDISYESEGQDYGNADQRMTDGERLNEYRRLEEDLQTISTNLSTYYDAYKKINSELAILKRILK